MSASNYLETKILDHIMNYSTAPFTGVDTLYVALATSNSTDTAAGTELSGNGYSRAAVTFGSANAGVITNDASVSIGPASTNSWAGVRSIMIYDASSGGNMWFYRNIGAVDVGVGEAVNIAVGSFTVSLD